MTLLEDNLRRLARLFLIYNLLEINGRATGQEMAAVCQCALKTIRRDLEFLREAGAEIAYRNNALGYVLEKPLPFLQVQLCLTDLLALAMTQREADGGATSLDLAAQGAFTRLTSHLPHHLREELVNSRNVVHNGTTARRNYSQTHWRDLIDAARRRQTVEASFYSISSDKVSLRLIDPYHLTMRAGYLNLVGYCHRRGEVRFFALDGFRAIRISDQTFEIAAGFSLAGFLENSVGLLRGEAVEIAVVFDASIARWAERRRWEFRHTLNPQSDGSLLLRGTVSGLLEIQRELRSWGAQVEVLEPPLLREAMQREAAAVVTRYADGDGYKPSFVENK